MQDSFEARFSDFAKEEHNISLIINPFAITGEKFSNLHPSIHVTYILR